MSKGLQNQHTNIHFTMERESNQVLPFLDVLLNNKSPQRPPKSRPSLGFGRMSTFHAEFWTLSRGLTLYGYQWFRPLVCHAVMQRSTPCEILLLNRLLGLGLNENLLLLNLLLHFFYLVPCIWEF